MRKDNVINVDFGKGKSSGKGRGGGLGSSLLGKPSGEVKLECIVGGMEGKEISSSGHPKQGYEPEVVRNLKSAVEDFSKVIELTPEDNYMHRMSTLRRAISYCMIGFHTDEIKYFRLCVKDIKTCWDYRSLLKELGDDGDFKRLEDSASYSYQRVKDYEAGFRSPVD